MSGGAGRTPHGWPPWQVHLAGAAACLVLTFAGYALVVRPIAVEQQTRSALRAELEGERQQAHQVTASREALDRELARIRDALAASPLQLEPVTHLNARLARIVEFATDAGMEIHETQAGDVVEGEWHHTVPVRVSGRGSFSSCAVFLHRVYERLPDVEVLAFRISGTPSDPQAQSSFQFDLAWYAQALMAAGGED